MWRPIGSQRHGSCKGRSPVARHKPNRRLSFRLAGFGRPQEKQVCLNESVIGPRCAQLTRNTSYYKLQWPDASESLEPEGRIQEVLLGLEQTKVSAVCYPFFGGLILKWC
ncbi:hypothetical protein PILCRDRAFT_817667 [Piloderma croceum F 1598]|uniref:Uncharacterized protein n=1 Tax=Piloderma croceum (strain F 1598) TaxID=765440 RepID=A0A0C3C5D1_PILCF|nr:hypothetical protein PILCRDRAFT_817667 [Piloderma croceum F 1598]